MSHFLLIFQLKALLISRKNTQKRLFWARERSQRPRWLHDATRILPALFTKTRSSTRNNEKIVVWWLINETIVQLTFMDVDGFVPGFYFVVDFGIFNDDAICSACELSTFSMIDVSSKWFIMHSYRSLPWRASRSVKPCGIVSKRRILLMDRKTFRYTKILLKQWSFSCNEKKKSASENVEKREAKTLASLMVLKKVHFWSIHHRSRAFLVLVLFSAQPQME